MLLHNALSHRSWIYIRGYRNTYVYMGWFANPGWYLCYCLFGCCYQRRFVGDCFVGVSVAYHVFAVQSENTDICHWKLLL